MLSQLQESSGRILDEEVQDLFKGSAVEKSPPEALSIDACVLGGEVHCDVSFSIFVCDQVIFYSYYSKRIDKVFTLANIEKELTKKFGSAVFENYSRLFRRKECFSFQLFQ